VGFRQSSSGSKLRALLDDAHRAYAEGGDTRALQASLDALTGRQPDGPGTRVVCVRSHAHALADISGTGALVYVIG
jgi:hypothetical protein